MQNPSNNLISAITALQNGSPVFIFDFDDREGETDVIYPAHGLNALSIKFVKDLCNNNLSATIPNSFARKIGLLPLGQVINNLYPDIKFQADTLPNFTFPIDHISVKSGCTYTDYAVTLNSLTDLYMKINAEILPFESLPSFFIQNFRIPGHVPLLVAAEGLLSHRRGHTELGMALAYFASISPILIISELIDRETGQALRKNKSLEIANQKNIPFMHGTDIINAWEKEKFQ